ncbi:unnamed protein product [Amoebophrya sp. A120]|nr:unnamed protein product [Amoebophrya sp. A120]|eukprot:GSA120T00010188001.1
MVARKTGYLAAHELLKHRLGPKVATFKDIAGFNCDKKNLRGEKKLVLLCTREECQEGIEFRAVREMHVIDVPSFAAQYCQIVGRPVRVDSHASLPANERTVEIFLHIATLPDGETRQRERKILALAQHQKTWRMKMEEGLREWEVDVNQPPKGIRGLVATQVVYPKKTIDQEIVQSLRRELSSRNNELEALRAGALDAGLL